jgi:hypothetical protein
MVSHTQQNYINPWIGWDFAPINLTLDMVSQKQQKSTNPWIGWIFAVT